MVEINELEEMFMEKMQEAAQSGDSEKIFNLSKAGSLIAEIKMLNETLQSKYNQAKAMISVSYPIVFTQTLTTGSLSNSYFSLRSDSELQPIKPADNQEILVDFVGSGTVTTRFLKRYNRLRDRGLVAQFYSDNGLMIGAVLQITQLSLTEFRIEVLKKF